MRHSKIILAVAAVGLSSAASAGGNSNNLRGHYVDNNRGGQVQSIRINRHGVQVDCRRDRICSGSADVRRRDGNFIRAVNKTHRAKTVFSIHRINDRAISVNTRIKFRDGRVREFSDRLVRSRRAHTNNHHTYNSHNTLSATTHVGYSHHNNHGSINFNWNPVSHAAHYLLEFACNGHKCGAHSNYHRKVYSTNYRHTAPHNNHNYRYRVVAVDRHGRRGHASAWNNSSRHQNRNNRRHTRNDHRQDRRSNRREHRRNHH